MKKNQWAAYRVNKKFVRTNDIFLEYIQIEKKNGDHCKGQQSQSRNKHMKVEQTDSIAKRTIIAAERSNTNAQRSRMK